MTGFHRLDNVEPDDGPPTDSHALAQSNDHQDQGLAQLNHGSTEVKDLGWNDPIEAIPGPLVGGLSNEDTFLLIRRLNKCIYHVKSTNQPVPGNLDLNYSPEQEFTPDKLRSQLERFYMTCILSLMSSGAQIARLRSWRESRRTTCFAAAYTIAWMFDYLTALFVSTAILLIVYPPARSILFPPAPLALVNKSTGGVQKPKAGVLGSTDTATGAPENHKGEAQEAEASNFVNSIASIGLSTAAGKHPQADVAGKDDSDAVPDPTALIDSAGAARKKAAHGTDVDKAKVPVQTAMWSQMGTVLGVIQDLCDTVEKLGNALSPTPPFPKNAFKLRLASLLVPLLAASFYVTTYMLIKGFSFGVGFGFFSEPLIMPAIRYLNTHYPNWQKLLEVRNLILLGAPTDSQLALCLLRIGEVNRSPLPPPPTSLTPPPDEPAEITDEHLRAVGSDYPMNASEAELTAAMAVHDPNTKHETSGADIDASMDKKHGKKGSKILNVLKSTVKGTIEATLSTDKIKATVSEKARNRLGVVPKHPETLLSGPVDFAARYHGKRGHAYIVCNSVTPCVAFSLLPDLAKTGSAGRNATELKPVFSIAIDDITEVKKTPGLNWKARLVAGWALDTRLADGITIVTKTGQEYLLTAMVLRDELFNRLISIPKTIKWEAY